MGHRFSHLAGLQKSRNKESEYHNEIFLKKD